MIIIKQTNVKVNIRAEKEQRNKPLLPLVLTSQKMLLFQSVSHWIADGTRIQASMYSDIKFAFLFFFYKKSHYFNPCLPVLLAEPEVQASMHPDNIIIKQKGAKVN